MTKTKQLKVEYRGFEITWYDGWWWVEQADKRWNRGRLLTLPSVVRVLDKFWAALDE